MNDERYPGKLVAVVLILSTTAAMGEMQSAGRPTVERSWQILLDGIFRDGTKPLYLYARERAGRNIANAESAILELPRT